MQPTQPLPFRGSVRDALANNNTPNETFLLVAAMHTFPQEENPESPAMTARELDALQRSSEEGRSSYHHRTIDHTNRTLLRLNSGFKSVGWVSLT